MGEKGSLQTALLYLAIGMRMGEKRSLRIALLLFL
jgi:hypothetical protein